MEYTCTKCSLVKSKSDFPKHTLTKLGIILTCKACRNIRMREHRINNLDKVRKQARECAKRRYKERQIPYQLMRKYGLTLEEYNRILVNQDYKCKICKISNTKTRLVVDHSHSTNKVRGLLCDKCNTALGMFRDNTDFLYSAIYYLQCHEHLIEEKLKTHMTL